MQLGSTRPLQHYKPGAVQGISNSWRTSNIQTHGVHLPRAWTTRPNSTASRLRGCASALPAPPATPGPALCCPIAHDAPRCSPTPSRHRVRHRSARRFPHRRPHAVSQCPDLLRVVELARRDRIDESASDLHLQLTRPPAPRPRLTPHVTPTLACSRPTGPYRLIRTSA